jgi:hypothetical protein
MRIIGNLRLQDDGSDVTGDEYPSVPFWSEAGELGSEKNDPVIVTQPQNCEMVMSDYLQVFKGEVDACGDKGRRGCEADDIGS